MSEAPLRVFAYGQGEAARRGLLLVDAKYSLARKHPATTKVIPALQNYYYNYYVQRHVSSICKVVVIAGERGGAASV